MCGIFGIIDPSGRIDESVVSRCTDLMALRGPDARGVWLSPDRRFALGHRRLSILDLDPRSNQPFVSDDGKLALTYNGEIYNFRDVRKLLIAKGHHFRTESDTEMILHAYEEWDVDCLERFRGMFSFALVDLRSNRVWMARDRFGKKPFLYYWKDNLLIFASEFQAILGTELCDNELDFSALYDSLTYLYIPAPKTAYKHIRKLEAGHWMLWENGQIRDQKYWDIVDIGTNHVDEQTAIQRARFLIDESVQLRLVSDVPVGIFLSGGVDSSAVTYFAQQHSATPLHTFSLGFDVKSDDELEYANLMAQRTGTNHVTRRYDLSSAREDTLRLMHAYGEPHGDSSIFPTTVVSRMARERVTVALSGEGGDEVFWGYNHYSAFLNLNRKRRYPLREQTSVAIQKMLPLTTRGRNRLLRYHLWDMDLYTLLLGGMTRLDKRQILDPDVFDSFRDYDEYWAYRMHWREDIPIASRLQYLDLKTYLAEDILMKIDRASMSVSLEARTPLLAYKLVEEVYSWPEEIRLGPGTLKYIFKKAMEGLLPGEILTKPKHGFNIPWRVWIRNWDELSSLRGHGKFFKKDLRLPHNYMILMLADWLRRYWRL